jgi:predicted alpha/beta-hydrolase family hydrolase
MAHHEPRNPVQVRVAVTPTQAVTSLVYRAGEESTSAAALILAHGAGAGQASPFMVRFATGLAARGIDAITFNFAYTENGKRLPDRNDALEACYRAIIGAARTGIFYPDLARRKLAIGGKSMGGRIASQVAAASPDGIAGLVFLGYPLHPPGRPDQLRSKHLTAIAAPMLFVQGSRDAFGTPEELRPILSGLPSRAELYVIAGGDHSFKVAKRSPISQDQVYDGVLDHIARWLTNLPPPG